MKLILKLTIPLLSIIYSGQIIAHNVPNTNPEDIFKRSEQRQQSINQKLMPNMDTQGSSFSVITPSSDVYHSTVCFPIDKLRINVLDGKKTISTLSKYITRAINLEEINPQKLDEFVFKLSNKKGQKPCLNVRQINKISINLQNELIKEGWITSRILVPGQSLTEGNLLFTLITGYLNDVIISDDKASAFTAFPSSKGDILNLRDLEQGLDNMRRLPTVSTEINIIPSKEKNASDVEVKWQQRKNPIRLNISIDDSGGKSTGRYLGTISVAWDNPLHLNDILSASYTHNLLAGQKVTDPKGNVDKGKTYSYSLGYSIPFGYWLVDIKANHYFYDQVVAGVNRNYHYTGDSDQMSADLSRVLYRDNKYKITFGIGAWFKETRSYIDDAEIDVQHRKVGGWKANITQRSYFTKGILSGSLTYKRGTRAFGAIAAPEELFNEGTAKAKIWMVDINWEMPFKWGKEKFEWHSQLHGQVNQTKLTPQDMFSLGGRYNVRGFSGEKTLSAERGWYFRNDVAWQYKDNHQLYLGADIGRLYGASTKNLQGNMLSGAVLGFKGQFNKGGKWHYDVFIGKPIYQPRGFNADSMVTGFNINYSY
ncbi:ShlB/FhaC/HecB family hemolysin secretion/activation protein [Pasteurella skyensis]|uniref:ShlB/FhaC/HecB family hemolysin secretion/activation protein n=1 Tax=Phocoenobacter skyensis TaxID=97481 RepID=A0AAJ6N8N7_9PAST|nr:ShlB/FhaC/HecB family hemolysin secretion/activation protein [Pasteurella skyensis]MDP8162412.1 ShlB/FhaC/HecB family hemolysin secretion/activation protein [Pasteurella skyensis]MDP8172254.1 ShlB/FhaC/HecB family hemolysin secretion/activation protein [Pasteurella skyensis]MDP8177112.1 ShlB/FhaC/HecB family hemolysin secretion/activation protein [Pasteurella skyensis]MDP8178509.1 ShlB/FhaC/HecB family hemolysin secretion/activation protein [Pasteurella skyensis]MDP8182511.1 ShlB/FhaC/HecB 